MNTDATALALSTAITSIPGVRGLEPGITSTLRTLDARLRRRKSSDAHYGIIIDHASRTATIEVALELTFPVRGIVEDVQRTLQRALDSTDHAAPTEDTPATARQWTVLVRVQSLTTTRSPRHDPGQPTQQSAKQESHPTPTA